MTFHKLFITTFQVPLHEHQPETFYNTQCKTCGGLCLYADDSTFSISSKNIDKLNEDVDAKYKIIAEYMDKNKLIRHT